LYLAREHVGVRQKFLKSAVSFAELRLLYLVPHTCGSLLKHRLKIENITEVQPLLRRAPKLLGTTIGHGPLERQLSGFGA
jgi:hypothetical protein